VRCDACLFLRHYDGPSRRQHDATVPCELQRRREVCIAEGADVAIIERGFRDDEHVPKAAASLDKEHLGGLVERKEVTMVAVAKFPPEELTDEAHLRFIEGRLYRSAIRTHQ
jgi:hypothetical protein